MDCLNALPLDKLDPLSDVTMAVTKSSLLSDPHITNPAAGSVYVFMKGPGRWNDGMQWPFKTHRHQHGQEYQMYHGVNERHLSGSHAPSSGTAYRCFSRR
jgi:hypothetical protein